MTAQGAEELNNAGLGGQWDTALVSPSMHPPGEAKKEKGSSQ